MPPEDPPTNSNTVRDGTQTAFGSSLSTTDVSPARARAIVEVVIRAGDVDREMGLVGVMTPVCSALGFGP